MSSAVNLLFGSVRLFHLMVWSSALACAIVTQYVGASSVQVMVNKSPDASVKPAQRDPFSVNPQLLNQGKSKYNEQFAPGALAIAERIKIKAILWQPKGQSIVSLLIDNRDVVTLRAGEALTVGSNALKVLAIDSDTVVLEAGFLPQGLMVLR